MKENKIINVQIDGKLSEKMYQVAQFLELPVQKLIKELLNVQTENILADIDNELCIETPKKKSKKTKKVKSSDQQDKKDNVL